MRKPGSVPDFSNGVYRQLDYYNDNARVLNGLIDRTKRNTIDDALMLLGPYFLAIALALRISKVLEKLGWNQGKRPKHNKASRAYCPAVGRNNHV